MRLQFLGTGAAFVTDPNNFQSNMLLETDADNGNPVRRMLIDCGGDCRRSLARQSLSQHDIDAVYISHLHADHIGGLEWLAFTTYFCDDLKKPILYVAEPLVGPLWDDCLKAGMEVIDYGKGTLADFFDIRVLGETGSFTWEGLRMTVEPTVHLQADDGSTMMSYGLTFHGEKTTAYLTTDSRPNREAMEPRYASADLIFQDCETADLPSGAHSHYSILKELPPEHKAKMWLYHYQDGDKPDCVADGFKGWVLPGQSFDL